MRGCTHRPVMTRSIFFALSWLSVVFLGPATANPLPAYALLVHVHPWTTNFCQSNTITQCSQVTQYSDVEGDVEFDLFLDNRFQIATPFADYAMTVTWPEGWQFVSFQDCLGGETTVTPGDQQVSLLVELGETLTPGPWLLLGRIRMQVSGFGALEFPQISLGGDYWGTVGPAMAGVDCTYRALNCSNLTDNCYAACTPDFMEMDVPQDGYIMTTLHVGTTWNGGPPCPVQFLENADWLQVDMAWDPGGYAGTLVIHIDARGLECDQDYQATIRAVSQVVTCVPVTIHVFEIMATPEDPTPATRTVSWSKLKHTYQ